MTSDTVEQPGSASIDRPDYWWYRAREVLLEAALGGYPDRPQRVLDVGSADAPSVSWLSSERPPYSLDLDPRGLQQGRGVCGSAERLPFADDSFDVVGAFDVIEHCADERGALTEIRRVLAPDGRLLLSVPAYSWAWSDHDVRAGHHRRYTRRRLVRALENAGFHVDRASHGFAGTFPFFTAERVVRRLRPGGSSDRLPEVSPWLTSVFLGLSRFEAGLLRRGINLPFGSSVFSAATPTD